MAVINVPRAYATSWLRGLISCVRWEGWEGIRGMGGGVKPPYRGLCSGGWGGFFGRICASQPLTFFQFCSQFFLLLWQVCSICTLPNPNPFVRPVAVLKDRAVRKSQKRCGWSPPPQNLILVGVQPPPAPPRLLFISGGLQFLGWGVDPQSQVTDR